LFPGADLFVAGSRTFVQLDPILVIPTCLFIAAKVEEAVILAQRLIENIQKQGEQNCFLWYDSHLTVQPSCQIPNSRTESPTSLRWNCL
jgi:hypothetical protein